MIEYIQGKLNSDGIFIVWLPSNDPVVWSTVPVERDGWWMHWSSDRAGFQRVIVSFKHPPTESKRMAVSDPGLQSLPHIIFNESGIPIVSGISIADQIILEKMVARARKIKRPRVAAVTGPSPVRL